MPPDAGDAPRPPAEPAPEGLPIPPDVPVRRNRPLLLLLGATGIQLTVNSALQFVLLIRVQELTGSSLAGAALIACLAAPPVLFGLGAGVLLDRLDKRATLIVAVVIRSGLTALLVLADGFSTGAIYAVAFLTAAAGQFAMPAGQSALPALVVRRRLLEANSAFQFAGMGTQLIGLVALSPIMLQAAGYDASYILSAALLLATAPMLALLPPLPPGGELPGPEAGSVRAAAARGLRDVRDASRLVWNDRFIAVALLLLVTGVMLLFMFANLVPRLTTDMLGRRPEDAVFFFWPTGVGALLSLYWLSRRGRRFGASGSARVASRGLALLAAAVAFFGILGFLRGSLGSDVLFFGVLVGAFPLGLGYGVLLAPPQTLIHERAPAEMRGRIFASQPMIANAISMPALIIVAGVSDAAGIEYSLILLAAAIAALTAASLWLGRPDRPDRPAAVP